MGYAATAQRLAKSVAVLEKIAEHERWCERWGESCPPAKAVRDKILGTELKDLELATALEEVDAKIRAVIGAG